MQRAAQATARMLVHGKLQDIPLYDVNDGLFVLKSPMLQHVLHLQADSRLLKRAIELAREGLADCLSQGTT